MGTTLTELITRGKQRADMVNSGFVTDDEWTHFINDEIQSAYAEMVNVDDGALFATVSPTLVAIGDNSYQLPSDFLRLVDVNVHTGNRWTEAVSADPQDYYQLLSQTYTGDYDVRYFLHLNIDQDRYELFMFPAKAVDNIGVRYIQDTPVLSLGSDTLNWPANWHETVVCGAAAKALAKEESDPTILILERDRAMKRVLKDIRAQKVSEIKMIRNIGSGSSWRRFRLPRIS